MTSELQLTLRDYQVLSERQYRLLQTHVIRLNNSLQDLQDDVSDLVHNVSAPPFFPLPWFTTSVLHLSSLCPGSQRQCFAFLPGSQRQCSTFLPFALVHNVSAPPFFPWPWFTTSVLHLSSFCPGSQRQCSTVLPFALVHNVSAPPFFLVHNASAPPFFPWPWFTTSVLNLSPLGPGSQRQCSAFLPLALVHNVSAPPFFPWPCTRCHAVGRSWDLTALFIVTVLQIQSEFSH